MSENTEIRLARVVIGNHSEEHLQEAVDAALGDAEHWKDEETLPNVDTMDLDWHLEPWMIKAGITSQDMQRLSFALIAYAK